MPLTETLKHLENTELYLLCNKPSTFKDVTHSRTSPRVSSLFKGGNSDSDGWEARNRMSCQVGAGS